MTMSARLRFAVAALLSSSQLTLGAYNLVKSYSGQNFFDNWSYYGNYDNLTNGDIIWVNQTVADGSPQLTYINGAGNAIVKVDNSTTVPYNDKRNSVRLTSNDKLGLGTVIVFDVLHVPFGCSVWPSLWTKAVGNLWPAGGEIDIFEAVNLQTANQMALHTTTGCTKANATQTGTTGNANCDNNSSTGAGCTVIDPSPDSYGAPFAAAGGGVWVTEFAETGINIWFFSRANVPSSLSTDSVDTSTLGTPTGAWPASSCNPSQFFQEQEIVIDITLCGDWAGLSNIISSTGCPALNGTNTCYTTYVLNPANYDTAYFEIASVKLFGTSPSVISTAAASTPTTSAGGHGSSSPSAADKQMSSAFLATAAVVFAGMGFLL